MTYLDGIRNGWLDASMWADSEYARKSPVYEYALGYRLGHHFYGKGMILEQALAQARREQ